MFMIKINATEEFQVSIYSFTWKFYKLGEQTWTSTLLNFIIKNPFSCHPMSAYLEGKQVTFTG